MQSLKIICPNGHLGFAPLRTGSFEIGVGARPDYIAADSGSDDVGPVPLGSDTSTSPEAWQRHDLEHMLLASRRLGVPMIIGSAGDTGTNSRVDLYVNIIRELAQKHGLKRFRIGYFYSEVPKSLLREKLGAGETIRGLDGFADLTLSELDGTDRIVAMAGVHPYLELLRRGADVVIGGRSSDAAVFAAPALHHGFAADHAYYLGKVLECASFCAEPYGGKETVLGEISRDDVRVTAMHPEQRCTVASVAGHAMYERSNPFEEFVAGGRLDMSQCHYEQVDPRTTRITGARFEPAEVVRVKLEGSGKVGERYVGLCGIRDPYTIANVDRVIAWAKDQVRARFGETGYELHYNVYGRDGVMGELEPLRDRPGHELCVMVQGVAPTREMAEEVAMIGLRQMFYARLPDVKGTAGSVSFPLDEVLHASPAYRWTLNHTVEVHDPLALFPTHLVEAGV
ncbi:acyclic terpene utilization AtuA family protein (plasmid) [Cupriavidus necator]|uniref:Acyclic terpene utilization AtuA family protein n=1 Tax=Cupriavidus necator TaxID=106590 RepID=A0A367PR00_CUPNE|nr:acyclic terpene utilization AtuA family protein [Cupriavidus necator]QQX89464.1 acyclic terpene utilization AtuA family protein [Cupriavidus necator]RCJ10351.1 acyclic terpene utilization AtuA family protein [Cupriavidus necator]